MTAEVEECLFSVAATHRGYRRDGNEDAVLARDRYGLWAVADGMGGHQRGDEASRAVVDSLDEMIAAQRGVPVETAIVPTLEDVNAQLHGRGAALGQGDVMGSTAVALVLEGADYHCFWVGDSRAYLFRDGCLEQMTSDHSECPDDASSATLTRAIGAEASVVVDRVTGELYEDDVFLLCSDGLTSTVDEVTIATTLAQTDPAEVADALIAEALAAGGPDNISVVAVFVRGGSG